MQIYLARAGRRRNPPGSVLLRGVLWKHVATAASHTTPVGTKIMTTSSDSERALCVDLDGTLLRTDMLYETALALLARNPFFVLLFPVWLLRGKATLKREISSRVAIDAGTLPYDARVVELLRTTSQRPRVLCTATDIRFAEQVASHLGVFEKVMASDGSRNLAGRKKADALVDEFGARNFDYLGNGRVDLHVWGKARKAWVVNGSRNLSTAAGRLCEVHAHWPHQSAGRIKTWLKAMRLHQWLKNLLVFVPLLAAHRVFEPAAAMDAMLAFVAFGLCASGVYVLNDLSDLTADRLHPRKRLRPFAAGDLPLAQGLLVAPSLTVAGFALAWWCSTGLALVLATYYAMTLGYSFHLKRIVMLDVVLLAGLYTIRLIGGAVAINSELSYWLLAFSMFIFLSLAMLKRYTELDTMLNDGKQIASGRGYEVADLPLIQSLGSSSGYIAVLVLALYINSPESIRLYSNPELLWLICPLVLYWISRAWIIAHRGIMHDDPIVFAARDRLSIVVLMLCAAISFAATR